MVSRAVIVFVFIGLLAGCASPARGPRLDPDAFGNDMGTLISIGDVRTVAEEMIQSMNRSPALSELRGRGPLDIVIGDFRQYTTVTNFDKRLFVNRLISSIQERDRDGDYRFVDRPRVTEERLRQASGEVEDRGLSELRGADWVLDGEVRELFHRAERPGGGEEQKRTVQYSLRLVRVADGTIVWADAHEVVKQQLIGLVYR